MRHVLRRLALFALTIWAAATLTFVLPRLAPQNPVAEALAQASLTRGGSGTGFDQLVASYGARFGLDRPVWEQYLSYLGDIARLDLNYSISSFPTRVSDLIAQALPWTLGLLVTSTLIAFVLGSILGALVVWPGSPRWIRQVTPVFMVLSAIPYYLIGLVLVYFLAFRAGIFPIGGGRTVGAETSISLTGFVDILHHAFLPGLSIVLTSIGFWALGMRGVAISVQGEDYMTFGQARALSERRLFWQYSMRNALLPQVTTLGLSLGHILTGAILVEVIFSYPGIGNLLLRAVTQNDYFTIYGIVLVVTLGISLAMLILDLIYPLLDPRIRRTARA